MNSPETPINSPENGFDDKTVRHHLEVLRENGIVESSGSEHGAVYLPIEQARSH